LVGLPGQWRDRLLGRMTGARDADNLKEVGHEIV
jgi:hypothetical protein